jgi:hypothetical protein
MTGALKQNIARRKWEVEKERKKGDMERSYEKSRWNYNDII